MMRIDLLLSRSSHALVGGFIRQVLSSSPVSKVICVYVRPPLPLTSTSPFNNTTPSLLLLPQYSTHNRNCRLQIFNYSYNAYAYPVVSCKLDMQDQRQDVPGSEMAPRFESGAPISYKVCRASLQVWTIRQRFIILALERSAYTLGSADRRGSYA